MLHSVLPAGKHHFRRDARNMAHELKTVGVGCLVKRQVSIAILNSSDLQEVNLASRQLRNNAASLIGGSDADACPLERFDPLRRRVFPHALYIAGGFEIWPRQKDAWSESNTRANFSTPA